MRAFMIRHFYFCPLWTLTALELDPPHSTKPIQTYTSNLSSTLQHIGFLQLDSISRKMNLCSCFAFHSQFKRDSETVRQSGMLGHETG